MARIRSVHQDQWIDPEFTECSPLARLLAIGIRNEADDNGIFEWHPAKLKIRLLPNDTCDVSDLLGELVKTNQVWQYEVGGKCYGLIRNFHRFQCPRKPNYRHPTPVGAMPGQGSYSVKCAVPVPVACDTGTVPPPGEKEKEKEMEKEKEKEKEKETPEPKAAEKTAAAAEEAFERQRTRDREVLHPACREIVERPTDCVLEFPVRGRGHMWRLTREKRDEWRQTYGDVLDVDAELRIALQWLMDNPARRKTAERMYHFLGGWLAREREFRLRQQPGKASRPRRDPAIERVLRERKAVRQ